MDVCFVFLCFYVVLFGVGRGLCDELITRTKESFHVSNKIKKSKKGGQGPAWAAKTTDNNNDSHDDDDDDKIKPRAIENIFTY